MRARDVLLPRVRARPGLGPARDGHGLHRGGLAGAGDDGVVDPRGGDQAPPPALPRCSRPRREMESTLTASNRTPPVMTNFWPEPRPSRPSPLSIETITSAPRSADLTCPRP